MQPRLIGQVGQHSKSQAKLIEDLLDTSHCDESNLTSELGEAAIDVARHQLTKIFQ